MKFTPTRDEACLASNRIAPRVRHMLTEEACGSYTRPRRPAHCRRRPASGRQTCRRWHWASNSRSGCRLHSGRRGSTYRWARSRTGPHQGSDRRVAREDPGARNEPFRSGGADSARESTSSLGSRRGRRPNEGGARLRRLHRRSVERLAVLGGVPEGEAFRLLRDDSVIDFGQAKSGGSTTCPPQSSCVATRLRGFGSGRLCSSVEVDLRA